MLLPSSGAAGKLSVRVTICWGSKITHS